MIDKLFEKAVKRRKENPEMRIGQALFGAHYEIYPMDNRELVGTEFDCYYNDSNVAKFLAKVWETEYS